MVSGYSSSTASVTEPKPGNVYLVEEKRPRASYELFEQMLGYGYSGLILTRDFPRKLMDEKEYAGCKVLWLTNLVGDGRINPTAIGILMSQIRAFVESQPRTTIIFDGLEYLISLNTYDRMLQFMNQLRDIVATNDCVFLVPVDPRTLSEKELALLERNLEPYVPRSDVDASEEPMLSTENGEIRLLDVRPR